MTVSVKKKISTNLCLIGDAEHERPVEENPEGVDVVAGEVEHDAARHEGVAALPHAREQRQPHPHARRPAVQPARKHGGKQGLGSGTHLELELAL